MASFRKKHARQTVKGEEMLYPIQQKDLYLYPWFGLFAGFKKELQETRDWIVIGYSFNDEFILSMFKEILSAGNHNMILVDPLAYQIVGSKFKGFKNIKWAGAKFGEPGINDYVINKLLK